MTFSETRAHEGNLADQWSVDGSVQGICVHVNQPEAVEGMGFHERMQRFINQNSAGVKAIVFITDEVGVTGDRVEGQLDQRDLAPYSEVLGGLLTAGPSLASWKTTEKSHFAIVMRGLGTAPNPIYSGLVDVEPPALVKADMFSRLEGLHGQAVKLSVQGGLYILGSCIEPPAEAGV